MLPEMPPEIREARHSGIAFFAGEAEEGRLDLLLRDAESGTLRPLYDFMDELPVLEGEPPPILPRQHVRRTSGTSPASIPAAAARISARSARSSTCRAASARFRSPDDVERHHPREPRAGRQALLHHRRQLRPQQGLGAAPRPADQAARGEGLNVQASSSRSIRSATRSRTSSRRRARAGVRRVFIGLENINPENLIGGKKRQNRSPSIARCCRSGGRHGAITYAGYIIGFPDDTHGIDPARHRDHPARAAARLPGILHSDAAAWLGGPQEAVRTGTWMDPDMNKYDFNHLVREHPRMSDAEWNAAYRAASGELLHAGACAHDPAPRGRAPTRSAEDRADHDPVVQADDPVRGECIRWRAGPSA